MQRRAIITNTYRALLFLLGALMFVVFISGTQAEMKAINPFAPENAPAAAPPSAFVSPNAARQSPGAFGGIFGWVLRTQQSLQGELAAGVKNLKGDHAMAGAFMLAATF